MRKMGYYRTVVLLGAAALLFGAPATASGNGEAGKSGYERETLEEGEALTEETELSEKTAAEETGLSEKTSMEEAELSKESLNEMEQNLQEITKELENMEFGVPEEPEDETKGPSFYAGTMDGSQSSGSIQQLFAQMQASQAQTLKDQAIGYIEQIDELQEKQRLCVSILEQLHTVREDASAGRKKLPDRLPESLRGQIIAGRVCPEQASLLQEPLTMNHLQLLIQLTEEELNQTNEMASSYMGNVQDFMGQYNSYTSQSSQMITQNGEMLQALLARGQTMAGGGTGMLFTGILGGALAGVLGTLLIQKSRKKKAGNK